MCISSTPDVLPIGEGETSTELMGQVLVVVEPLVEIFKKSLSYNVNF